MSVVAVLHYPWGEDYGVSRTAPRTPRRAYASAIAYRANPRPPAYMQAVLSEMAPEAELVSTADPEWERTAQAADRLIAVYPDSTGLGWSPMERRLEGLSAAPIEVINGRRRRFALNRRTRAALRVRRALERSMLVEALVVGAFALATPLIAAYDLLRGRR